MKDSKSIDVQELRNAQAKHHDRCQEPNRNERVLQICPAHAHEPKHHEAEAQHRQRTDPRQDLPQRKALQRVHTPALRPGLGADRVLCVLGDHRERAAQAIGLLRSVDARHELRGGDAHVHVVGLDEAVFVGGAGDGEARLHADDLVLTVVGSREADEVDAQAALPGEEATFPAADFGVLACQLLAQVLVVAEVVDGFQELELCDSRLGPWPVDAPVDLFGGVLWVQCCRCICCNVGTG